MNLVPGFHLGSVLPVESLEKKWKEIAREKYQAGTVLMNEDFEKVSWIPKWGRIWSREPGLAEYKYTQDGERSSRYLKVISQSVKDWGVWPDTYIDVRPGDRFLIEGSMKVMGSGHSDIGVALYDEGRKIVEWSFGKITASDNTGWQKLSGGFRVPDGVRFIRVRLSGTGQGMFGFDDVVLKCVEKV